MPIYATIADMRLAVPELELIQLTDDARTGTVDEAAITRALDTADNMIDGYLGRRFRRTDTVLPVPPLLVTLACDIAHFRLFRHAEPTEHVKAKNKIALATLADIRDGKQDIGAGEEVVAERDGLILLDAPVRNYSRDDLAGA